MRIPLHQQIISEEKTCECSMNACCGECLAKERSQHLIFWLVLVMVVAAVTALSLAGKTSL